ncbi:site-2 protease family protein [Actinocrinis puniceicyclus]|uniref:Zinc metalloprotease n=1 Tax=Actinocrinis puniceicyclus TaxID=977794 RepID=A0A8J7WG57_9ACTN|nr:site-2 protease family protein [Actinocrinis puniceicyclus]MBS2961621.1 site-2 protease family protein [Actinocrinis puniceicyclus]
MSDTNPNEGDSSGNPEQTPPPGAGRPSGGGLAMGRPFGIPIVVSPTWFLIAAFITFYFGEQFKNTRLGDRVGEGRYLVAFGFAVLLYLSVLLHELAHSVVAKHFGLPVRRIVIYFLGGVSEIEREPESPGQEFAVAIAGPALSFTLAGAFWGIWEALPSTSDDTPTALMVVIYLVSAVWTANLVVGVFNMLPGLPLDGGRVLRSAVWAVTKKPMNGTVAAAWAGRGLAVFVLLFSIWQGRGQSGTGADLYTIMWAAFIASFIWIGASQSLTVARLRDRIPRLQVRALTRRAIPVNADMPLAEALRRAAAAGARAVIVVDHAGKPTAIVHEASVTATPPERHPWVQVGALSRALRPGMTLTTDLSGERLLAALRAAPAPEYLVTEPGGSIYGVLAAADVEHAFLNG